MDADLRRLRVAAVAVAGAFAGWSLLENGGVPVFPLDDAYIHLRYARAWAEGHPFVYQSGEGPGTGATSLLWPILLAPVAALGPDPMWAAWAWCLVLGTLGFALVADGTYRYLRAEDPDDVRRARAGAVFVLGFGPLVWTVVSGMEGALAAGSLAQTLAALRAGPWAPAGGALRGGDPPAPGRIPAWAWASVLAALRPEGGLLVGLIVVGDLLRAYRTPGPGTLRARRGWAVPVLVGAVQPVVHLVLSGRLMGTSGLAKASRFAWAKETFPVTVLWHDFVLGGWGDHLAQGFGRLVPVTILAGVVRAVRRDGGVLLIACWLAPMVLLSVTLPIAWHHYRYLHLLVPVVAMLVADPVAWALGRCGEAARPAGWVLAACWSMGGAAWADTLAQNAADVRMQHVAMGRWVAAHLPPDARIVAGDVGALTWFGERRFIDLEGIVTPGMLRHAAAGEGSLYARLRALRPTHAVYYGDAWYPGIGAAGAFVEERRAVLVDRTIAGARAMLLGVADPAVFASADAPPRLEAGERWCARVDAADLDSEAAAHWEELPGTRPLGAPAHPVPTRVMRLTAPFGESPIVDDVRRVFGTQVFRVPCGAARGGRLVARLAQQNAPSSFVVGIGGRAVGRLVLPVHATRWIEVSVDLPEGYAGEEIAVVPVEDTPGDAGGLVVARWWRVVGGTPARADAAQASP